MKSKKTFLKSLVFGMALTALPFMGLGFTSTIKAAPPTAVTFDGSKAIVTTTSTDKVFWGIATKLKAKPKKVSTVIHLNKNTNDWYQVKKLEEMIGKEADLSKYRGKAVIIVVGSATDFTNAADWELKTIPAAEKKFKVYYTNSKAVSKYVKTPDETPGGIYGYLAFHKGNEQMTKTTAKDSVEVRVGSGDWKPVTYFGSALADNDVTSKLQLLTQNGAKLSFRLKGTADAWGTKAVSVNVPKQAKGPSVKLDIKKLESNLKKGKHEYKIQAENAAAPADDFTAAKGKDNFTDLSITFNGDTQVLYTREIQTAKKMASKLSKLVIKKQSPVVLAVDKVEAQKATLVASALDFALDVDYDVNKGATLTNSSETVDYEIAVSYDGADTNLKWIQLKKAKDATKPTKLKIKASKTKKNGTFNPVVGSTPSKIFIRIPAPKQKNANEIILPSESVAFTIKAVNIEQALTITTANAGKYEVTAADGTAIGLKLTQGTADDLSIGFKITNVTKRTGKPKFKAESVPKNIKVNVDEMVEEGGKNVTFNVNVAISENAFPSSEPSGAFKFTIEHESTKKTYTVTLKKST